MKRKGFTLIELLAVIVVLAVIALITTPTILGVIEKSRKSSYKASMYGIINAADIYLAQNLGKISNNEEIVFTCDGVKCSNSEGDKLSFKGKIPKSGSVIIDSKQHVKIEYVSDEKFCAYGDMDELIIEKDCLNMDLTEAQIDENKLILTSATNSITVKILEGFAQDLESGIKEYKVTVNGKTQKLTKIGNLIFDNLEKNKNYEITIEVENGKGLKSKLIKERETLEIQNPTITYINIPTVASNGYLKSQEVKVDYNESNFEYFIKTTRKGISDITVTESCGSDVMPNVCNSVTETKNLSPNTWYKVTKNVSVTYNSSSSETAIFYAVSYDGINYSGISTGTVHKIDTTNPVLEINDVTITPSSLKVNYNLSDSESGIGLITCQYKLENSEYQSVAMDHVTSNSCNITGLSQSTNYIYNICVTDKVENGPICKSGNAITSNQTNSNLMINNKIASNLMSDGGFDSSDISYFYNDNNYSWDNGTIKMVANSQQKFLRKNLEQFSGLTNHVLYARVSTKKTDASLHPGLYVITAAEFSYWHDQDSSCSNFEEDDKTNTWKNVSCIFTSKYDKLTNTMIAQSNGEGTGVMYFDNFLILDLTEIFGSGNEPTRDWCDQNIQFPQ